MGKYDKSYEAFKLPSEQPGGQGIRPSSHPGGLSGHRDSGREAGGKETFGEEHSPQDGMFCEIEYDPAPMPAQGESVQKTQKLQEPERDEIRELFTRMRDIARSSRVLVFGNSRFYNKSAQTEGSRIFYKQGMFMKDFEDDYEDSVPCMEYYPSYQMLGYRQLRTYFTWRTALRGGEVTDTSLSYAYLYIYELLNNIGVEDPQDGLDRLLSFWREFRKFQPSVDKYMYQWLKDYHIYYDLPWTFAEFVRDNELGEHYPELSDLSDGFEFYCALSKYDIRKSVFYGEGREALIRDCFEYTFKKLTAVLDEKEIKLENMIFLPVKSMAVWRPFQEALFFPWRVQRDRLVTISAREVYECRQNQWTYRTALTAESGRQLLGYILKQMEAVLRRILHYKYKITAGVGTLSSVTAGLMEEAGISLEKCIESAVTEFYREATRTVVTVDREALNKIRREALKTQEKLLVPEDEESALWDCFDSGEGSTSEQADSFERIDTSEQADSFERIDTSEQDNPSKQIDSASWEDKPWIGLRQMLTGMEREALQLILRGNADLKEFADAHGIMLEVLADGINEKAVDAVGDSLLDSELMVYEDYLEQVRRMLEL